MPARLNKGKKNRRMNKKNKGGVPAKLKTQTVDAADASVPQHKQSSLPVVVEEPEPVIRSLHNDTRGGSQLPSLAQTFVEQKLECENPSVLKHCPRVIQHDAVTATSTMASAGTQTSFQPQPLELKPRVIQRDSRLSAATVVQPQPRVTQHDVRPSKPPMRKARLNDDYDAYGMMWGKPGYKPENKEDCKQALKLAPPYDHAVRDLNSFGLHNIRTIFDATLGYGVMAAAAIECFKPRNFTGYDVDSTALAYGEHNVRKKILDCGVQCHVSFRQQDSSSSRKNECTLMLLDPYFDDKNVKVTAKTLLEFLFHHVWRYCILRVAINWLNSEQCALIKKVFKVQTRQRGKYAYLYLQRGWTFPMIAGDMEDQDLAILKREFKSKYVLMPGSHPHAFMAGLRTCMQALVQYDIAMQLQRGEYYADFYGCGRLPDTRKWCFMPIKNEKDRTRSKPPMNTCACEFVCDHARRRFRGEPPSYGMMVDAIYYLRDVEIAAFVQSTKYKKLFFVYHKMDKRVGSAFNGAYQWRTDGDNVIVSIGNSAKDAVESYRHPRRWLTQRFVVDGVNYNVVETKTVGCYVAGYIAVGHPLQQSVASPDYNPVSPPSGAACSSDVGSTISTISTTGVFDPFALPPPAPLRRQTASTSLLAQPQVAAPQPAQAVVSAVAPTASVSVSAPTASVSPVVPVPKPIVSAKSDLVSEGPYCNFVDGESLYKVPCGDTGVYIEAINKIIPFDDIYYLAGFRPVARENMTWDYDLMTAVDNPLRPSLMPQSVFNRVVSDGVTGNSLKVGPQFYARRIASWLRGFDGDISWAKRFVELETKSLNQELRSMAKNFPSAESVADAASARAGETTLYDVGNALIQDVIDVYQSNVGFMSGIWQILKAFKNRFFQLLKVLWDYDLAHKTRIVLFFMAVWLFMRKARSNYSSIHEILMKITRVFSQDAAVAMDLANECVNVMNTSAVVEILKDEPQVASYFWEIALASASLSVVLCVISDYIWKPLTIKRSDESWYEHAKKNKYAYGRYALIMALSTMLMRRRFDYDVIDRPQIPFPELPDVDGVFEVFDPDSSLPNRTFVQNDASVPGVSPSTALAKVLRTCGDCGDPDNGKPLLNWHLQSSMSTDALGVESATRYSQNKYSQCVDGLVKDSSWWDALRKSADWLNRPELIDRLEMYHRFKPTWLNNWRDNCSVEDIRGFFDIRDHGIHWDPWDWKVSEIIDGIFPYPDTVRSAVDKIREQMIRADIEKYELQMSPSGLGVSAKVNARYCAGELVKSVPRQAIALKEYVAEAACVAIAAFVALAIASPPRKQLAMRVVGQTYTSNEATGQLKWNTSIKINEVGYGNGPRDILQILPGVTNATWKFPERTTENLYSAIAFRQLRFNGLTPNERVLMDYQMFMRRFVKLFPQLSDCVPDHDEWLASRDYPKRKVKRSEQGWGEYTDAHYIDPVRTAFIKNEFTNKGRDSAPRLVCMREPSVIAAHGPVVKHMTDVVKDFCNGVDSPFVWTSGLTQEEIADKVEYAIDCVGGQLWFGENDYSQYDSSQNPMILRAEGYFYEHMLAHLHDDERVRSFLDDHERNIGQWRINGYDRSGTDITATVVGTRTTGDAKTTLGNTLTNLGLLCFNYCKLYDLSIEDLFKYRKHARTSFLVSGDDSLIIGGKEVKDLDMSLIQQCGVKCGYKVTDRMVEAEYCSLWFTWGQVDDERHVMPMKKFGRLFSRTPLAPPIKAPRDNIKAWHTLASQKCEAYIDAFGWLPSAVQYYEALRDKHRILGCRDKASRSNRYSPKGAPVKPIEPADVAYYNYDRKWSVCSELVEGICERYDVSALDVCDWFAWFRKKDFSLDITHPLPWRFAEVDCFYDGEPIDSTPVAFF
jgi:hypothetical protein